MSFFQCIGIVIVIVIGLSLSACSDQQPPQFLGYVEGQYVYLSTPVSGYLTHLGVHKGDTVKPGVIAFQLNSEPELSELNTAKAELQAALHQLDNLKLGERETILKKLEAQLAQAQSNLSFSKKMHDRNQRLIKTGAIDQAAVDRSRTAYQTDLKKLEEAQANLAEAKQGARTQTILVQESQVKAASDRVHRLQWLLNQKTIHIPQDGFIQDVLFRENEFVPAGNPVISLLPPKNRILIFFVPEETLNHIKIGTPIFFTCDGCSDHERGMINHISSQAEFTPPVIYSKDSRHKLVYWIEAKIDSKDVTQFHPGEPIQVKLRHE